MVQAATAQQLRRLGTAMMCLEGGVMIAAAAASPKRIALCCLLGLSDGEVISLLYIKALR